MDTLEDCTMLSMIHESLKRLYQIEPTTNILVRRILEKYYADAEMRALTSIYRNAETKYEFFLTKYGHLANRISLTHDACFLAIGLATLSRRRAEKDFKK